MLWQTPALAMTAQAFLLTIAYGNGSEIARIVTACLGVAVAFMSMQLMSKHRFLKRIDEHKAQDLEDELKLLGIATRSWAYRRGAYIQQIPRQNRWNNLPSYWVFTYVMTWAGCLGAP